MKAISDKIVPYAGKRNGHFLVLVLIFLACGFLIGIIVHPMIPAFWIRPSLSLQPKATQPSSQINLDPTNLQLVERVKDAVTHLNATLTIIGLMATLIGIALGLSIWKTREYAIGLLDQHFLLFKSRDLDPVLKKSKEELIDLNNKGLSLILKGSDILLNDLFQESHVMYKEILEQKGVTGDPLKSLLQNREESFRTSREITEYLIASLSRDEEIVIDMCHKLSALMDRKAFLTKVSLVQERIASLLNTWGPGTPVRTELVRLMDEINRRAVVI
jgi:hypothetical protein